mgnify:CR=1 FL=1
MCNPLEESSGKNNNSSANKPKLTRQEVQKHNTKDSKWIIIDSKVYDITNFSKRHPGGARVISHAAGDDATVSIYSIQRSCPHSDLTAYPFGQITDLQCLMIK